MPTSKRTYDNFRARGGDHNRTVLGRVVELSIKPEAIFHDTAYPGGGSSTILDCGRRGIYIGFPLLQSCEMALKQYKVQALACVVAQQQPKG